MHFSEISISNNLETLKLKNFSFWANYVDAYRGITKQVNNLLDSNFKKLATICYVIIKLSESKPTKGAFTYYLITKGEGVPKVLMHDYRKKWLYNKWMLLTMAFVNFYQSNLYFSYLNFFDFMRYLCWVLFKF